MAIPVIQTPVSPEPKSQHVTDPAVLPFLQDGFDPVDYLNQTLPPLAVSSSTTSRTTQSSAQHGRQTVPLSELNSQLQTLLSQINAQTTRLSDVLTQLSDEIIRSGTRLAYEVEVLGADAATLEDSLQSTLKGDIELLAADEKQEDKSQKDGTVTETETNGAEPKGEDYLKRLESLSLVRSRLDSVIKIFGEAMAWPLAPSETSIGGSFISVSAPDSAGDGRDREEKGREYMERLRNEIDGHLNASHDPSGVDAAAKRIDELRRLAEVWKGTAEEKARIRLVEGLQKPVDERAKALERANSSRRQTPSPARAMDYRYGGLI